jgi:putative endonuclease
MFWYVYLLLCDQKTFYVGISNNLLNRLKQHIKGESFHTSKFSDLKLAYVELYPDKYEAARREKQLKGWGHIKKQKLIESKIDPHQCTEIVEVMLRKDKILVSLLRA